MGQVARLYHAEELHLDSRRLRALVADPHDVGADRVVTRAMDEIVVRPTPIETAYGIGALDRVGRGAQSIVAIADRTSLAACAARLIRMGEMSLVTVSNVHDLSL